MKKGIVALVMMMSVGVMMAQNIAHVNSQKIIDTMPSRLAAENELAQMEERLSKDLQADQMKLQEDVRAFEAEAATLSKSLLEYEQSRLQKKQQALQAKAQEYDQKLQLYTQELNGPILEQVQAAIQKVAKAEGVDYVVDESMLLYMNGKDLTDKVIVEVLKAEKATTAN
ncbi:MAG: OmpH family outer membrane protein [Lishizhenia sp.]